MESDTAEKNIYEAEATSKTSTLEQNADAENVPVSPVVLRNRLDRYISFAQSVFFAACTQASWESVAISFQAGLLNGGPTSLVYGFLVAWIGALAVGFSFAEMASINPTVGAQYRWTKAYTPKGWGNPNFWALLQGWLTTFAWISTAAHPPFLMGTAIQGLIIFANPTTYDYKRWHGTLIAWALLFLPVICNIFARRSLRYVSWTGAFTHLGFYVIWIAVLLAMAPKSSSDFVFKTTITGLSGWSNTGVQWCIGLLSAVYPQGGADGIVHMSDEIKDPRRNVPKGIILPIFVNGAMAWIFMIIILFTIGNPETALESPTGYPIIEVLYNATGSKAATIILMSCLAWNGVVAMFGGFASTSRLTWAFARDHGIPFSEFFGRVHPTLRIPLNSFMLVTAVVVLLQLINIGSSTALFAILSLTSIAGQISYFFPILFFTLAKIRGDHIPYGPFRMPRGLDIGINIFALCYCVFVIIWLPFPPYQPVTAENMNYGGPIVGFLIMLAIMDWFVFGGKNRFELKENNPAARWNDAAEAY